MPTTIAAIHAAPDEELKLPSIGLRSELPFEAEVKLAEQLIGAPLTHGTKLNAPEETTDKAAFMWRFFLAASLTDLDVKTMAEPMGTSKGQERVDLARNVFDEHQGHLEAIYDDKPDKFTSAAPLSGLAREAFDTAISLLRDAMEAARLDAEARHTTVGSLVQEMGPREFILTYGAGRSPAPGESAPERAETFRELKELLSDYRIKLNAINGLSHIGVAGAKVDADAWDLSKRDKAPRPHQQEALEVTEARLADKPTGNTFLYEAATGTGKSLIQASIIRALCGMPANATADTHPDQRAITSNIVVAVPKLNLIEQFIGDLVGNFPELRDSIAIVASDADDTVKHLIIKKGTLENHTRITITSHQQLFDEKSEIHQLVKNGRVDAVFVDEAHYMLSDARLVRFKHLRSEGTDSADANWFLFTATPKYDDLKDLSQVAEKVFELPYQEALARKLIREARPRILEADTDISGVRKEKNGEYNIAGFTDAVMQDPNLHEKIVKHYLDNFDERQAVMFCGGTKIAEAIAQKFNEAGRYDVAFVSGETPLDKLKEIKERYKRGEIKVLLNADLLTEGFDAPCTSVIYNVAPTSSIVELMQRIGRGTRLHDGSDVCDVVDVVYKRSNTESESGRPAHLLSYYLLNQLVNTEQRINPRGDGDTEGPEENTGGSSGPTGWIPVVDGEITVNHLIEWAADWSAMYDRQTARITELREKKESLQKGIPFDTLARRLQISPLALEARIAVLLDHEPSAEKWVTKEDSEDPSTWLLDRDVAPWLDARFADDNYVAKASDVRFEKKSLAAAFPEHKLAIEKIMGKGGPAAEFATAIDDAAEVLGHRALEVKLTKNFQSSNRYVDTTPKGREVLAAVLHHDPEKTPRIADLNARLKEGLSTISRERDDETKIIDDKCREIEFDDKKTFKQWDAGTGKFVSVCTIEAATEVEQALAALRAERDLCATQMELYRSRIAEMGRQKVSPTASWPSMIPAYGEFLAIPLTDDGRLALTANNLSANLLASCSFFHGLFKQHRLIQDGKIHPQAVDFLFELATGEPPSGEASVHQFGKFINEGNSRARSGIANFRNQFGGK